MHKPRCQWPGAAPQRTSWLLPRTGSSSWSHCLRWRTRRRSLSGSPPRSDTHIDWLILEMVESTAQKALMPKLLNERHCKLRFYNSRVKNLSHWNSFYLWTSKWLSAMIKCYQRKSSGQSADRHFNFIFLQYPWLLNPRALFLSLDQKFTVHPVQDWSHTEKKCLRRDRDS